MSSSNNSFALVTGGAGFVGSHLCTALLDRGENVLCLDNLFTGSKENIANIIDSPNFEFIECNINYLPSKEENPALHESNIHIIYNLACPASPVHYQHDPVETVRTNVVGTNNMLEFAREKNAIFLQASTSEVYGDPEVHPQPETYVGHVNPLGPRACYDEGKRCAETLCSDYHREYGLITKIVRIFNTFGPNMAENDGRVVSNFIMQALRGDAITMYGDGLQTRSFQYVSDLIRGLLLLADHPSFHGPVNIGTQYEMSMVDLAKKIIELTGSSSEIIFKDLPRDDPKQRRPDTSLAQKELGWQEEVSMEDGLRKAIEYFKERIAM